MAGLFAAGELSLSARGLATWDIARLDRTALAPEDWATQETPVKLTDGTTNGYGLGVFAGTANGHRFIEHSGEAVGFLSENIVFPDDKAAIVVFTNTQSSDVYQVLGQRLASIVLTPAAPDPADAAALAKARVVFDQLRGGTLDRTLLTADANFYFTPVTVGDYRDSLGPLGEPTEFVQVGKPQLRGGFLNRNFRVSYPATNLAISTYTELGENGLLEQFLVAASQK